MWILLFLKRQIYEIDFAGLRGSKGFDRGFAAGEAIRCDTLIANFKLNADNNTQYALAA